MTAAYDKEAALQLVAALRASEADPRPGVAVRDGYDGDPYVDGWDAAIAEHGAPLADQLEAAVAEVDRLTANAAALRAEFETDDPAQIAAMSRMVISDRDRMQDALAAADPQAEAALAIDVILEVNEGRPDTRVVQLAHQVLRMTARAQIAELEVAAMRPVVAAANGSYGSQRGGHFGQPHPTRAMTELADALDAYRAGAEARDIEVARIAGNAPGKGDG